MNEKTTQTFEVLQYLRKHGDGITSMQAFKMFGVTRLASIIHELRKKGYEIATVLEDGKNRYGGFMRYARYVIKEAE